MELGGLVVPAVAGIGVVPTSGELAAVVAVHLAADRLGVAAC